MKTDSELKEEVISEIDSDSPVDGAAIAVQVKDGMVTLSGHLTRLSQKHAVGKAAQRVTGVKGVTTELDFDLTADSGHPDTAIADMVESDIKGKVEADALTMQTRAFPSGQCVDYPDVSGVDR